jgi:hypothetical protein
MGKKENKEETKEETQEEEWYAVCHDTAYPSARYVTKKEFYKMHNDWIDLEWVQEQGFSYDRKAANIYGEGKDKQKYYERHNNRSRCI